MAMNFPPNPVDGQTANISNIIYTFNVGSNVWIVQTTPVTFGGGYFSGNGGEKSPENYGDIVRLHSNTLSQNVTVYAGNNAIATGPLIVFGAQTKITIEVGSRMRIV